MKKAFEWKIMNHDSIKNMKKKLNSWIFFKGIKDFHQSWFDNKEKIDDNKIRSNEVIMIKNWTL